MGAIQQQATAQVLLKDATRVVVIDDEHVFTACVAKHLKDAGFVNTTGINDSSQALDQMRREVPGIVLLDIHMPEVNGFDILKSIRADAELSHIPVLMLTADSDSQTKRTAFELGATDFLAKPIDSTELLARVRNVLNAASSAEATEDTYERREARYQLTQPDVIESYVSKDTDGQESRVSVQLTDLSYSGGQLLAAEPMAVGQSLVLTLRVAKLDVELTISGQVRWCRVGSQSQCHVGCSFTNAFPADILELLAASEYVERRKDIRESVSLPAIAKQELKSQDPLHVRVIEYSSGGLRLFSPEAVKLNQRLLLDLRSASNTSICISVRLLWQRNVSDGFHLGCSFLSREGNTLLLECLPKKSRPEPRRTRTHGHRPRRSLRLSRTGWLALVVLIIGYGLGVLNGYRPIEPWKVNVASSNFGSVDEEAHDTSQVVDEPERSSSTHAENTGPKTASSPPSINEVIASSPRSPVGEVVQAEMEAHDSARKSIRQEAVRSVEPSSMVSEKGHADKPVNQHAALFPSGLSDDPDQELTRSFVPTLPLTVAFSKTRNDNLETSTGKATPKIDTEDSQSTTQDSGAVTTGNQGTLTAMESETKTEQHADESTLESIDHPMKIAKASEQVSRTQVIEHEKPLIEKADELPQMRKWSDESGRYHVRGKMIAIRDGKVQLLKENGKYCTLPMARLSKTDRLYVANNRADKNE